MERTYKAKKSDLVQFGFIICGTGKIVMGHGVEFVWIEEAVPQGACVYVALLKNGKVLKTGETSGKLKSRWYGTLRVTNFHARGKIERLGLREHEVAQGLRLFEGWGKQELELWAKPAIRVQIPYSGVAKTFPAHKTEELFLDDYFDPLFGQALADRKLRKKSLKG